MPASAPPRPDHLKAGEDNTIPAEAQPSSTFACCRRYIADVLWHVKKVIKDERVKFKPVEGKFNEALRLTTHWSGV